MKNRKDWMRSLLVSAVLALGLTGPVFAWPHASEEPGSVIVFHKFISGSVSDRPATQFEISVVCPKGDTCVLGNVNDPTTPRVRIRAHWVCPGDDLSVCQETDFDLETTVNGTIVFDAAGNGAPPPPCRRGYLIAWVVDEFGNGIKFDGLIGDALISTGPTSLRAFNAVPIQAAEWRANREVITGNNGPLIFDDNDYRAVSGKIFGTVKYEGSRPTVRTDLTLLTLDVNSNNENDRTFVTLNFHDEFETLHSTGTNFVCWDERSLSDIDPTLFGFGVKGLVESTSATQTAGPVTLLGIVETLEEVVLPVEVPGQTVFTQTTFPGCLPSGAVGGCFAFQSSTCQNNPIGCLFSPGNPACFTNIFCFVDVPGSVINTTQSRDAAYSLFNDGIGVPTTFFPIPPR